MKYIEVPEKPGVYEVRRIEQEERLTIGKTSDLHDRIQIQLVKDYGSHSTGEQIRVKEDVSKVVVRWAITDRPAAVEEELHSKYLEKHGKLPKYVKHT